MKSRRAGVSKKRLEEAKILKNFFRRLDCAQRQATTGGSVFWFVVYFSIVASIGIFVRDIPGQGYLFSTIENFTVPPALSKGSDPYSFASGALDIYRNGWIQPENQWLVKLWPPGFMVTEGLILKVFGIDAPFIFILILLNSALVAFLLLVMRLNLSAVIPTPFAELLPLAPFLFPVTRFFLLQPTGIVLGECFSIVLFMTSMFLVPLAIRNRSNKYAVLSGFILALSAYYRSQFELFVSFLTLLFILMALTYFLFFKWRMSDLDRRHITSVIKTVAIMLFVTHAVMMPWRIHNLNEPSTGNMSWVQTKTLTFTNAGKTDRELVEEGRRWIMLGRGNAACTVEPSYCGTANETAFYQAFIHHPIEWFLYKYDAVAGYWFASLQDFTSISVPVTASHFITNGVILFLVLANLALLLRIWRHPDFPVYVWQCISFYVGCFSVFMLVHFETRYFYALKIYGMFMFILFSAVAWRISRPNRTAPQSEQSAWFRYA